MSNEERKIVIESLVLNSTIYLLGISAVIFQFIIKAIRAGYFAGGFDMLRMYTNDGNILVLGVVTMNIIIDIISLKRNELFVTKNTFAFNLGAAVTSALIFAVVGFAGFPTMGIKVYGNYALAVLHFFNPVLVVTNFLLFVNGGDYVRKRCISISLIPTVTYAVVSMILCFTRVWTGDLVPYPFLNVYENPVWVSIVSGVGIIAVTVGLAYLFFFLNKKSSFFLRKSSKITREDKKEVFYD